jgi:hypothetical protein
MKAILLLKNVLAEENEALLKLKSLCKPLKIKLKNDFIILVTRIPRFAI